MTKKNFIPIFLLLVIVINTGVWLMGVFGLEVHVGSHVLGRYIGIYDTETWSSLLGWALALGGTVALIVLLYRNLH